MEKKLFAVDTNVLLHRAAKNELIIDALDTIKKRVKHAEIIVPPTVIQELAFFASEDHGARKELSLLALSNMLQWRFLPLNLIPVGHGIVEVIAQKIRDKRLLPESERNDSFIIAESSMIKASVLLSSDSHMLDINQNILKLLIDSYDVPAPIIVSPFEVVKKFFNG